MTPFEVEEQARKEAAAKLALRLPTDPWWDLFVTILWIGSRDFERLAPYIVMAQTVLRETFGETSAGAIVIMAATYLDPTRNSQDHREAAARLAKELFDQLIAGEVTGTGRLQGQAARADIPAREWVDLHFALDAPKEHYNTGFAVAGDAYLPGGCAYVGDPFRPGVRFWSAIVFSRASVMAAFPPEPRAGDSGPRAREREAERQLRDLAARHARGEGPVPVGAKWRTAAVEEFGLSGAGAQRVWRKVADQYPALSQRAGKPRPRRDR